MIATILSAISAIWGIIKLVGEVIAQVMAWLARRAVDQKDQALRDAEKEAEEAKTLKEKADAACKIEKILDPDSRCDGN